MEGSYVTEAEKENERSERERHVTEKQVKTGQREEGIRRQERREPGRTAGIVHGGGRP